MMQIDCEVTNTQVLQVSETDIPAHLRPRNHTTKEKTDHFGPQARQPYKPYFVRTGDINVQFATNRTSVPTQTGSMFTDAANKYVKHKKFPDFA
ncbi:hypothetical protein PR048_015891 [Dryococelus australis]|uniref:Uncharacterized protein n=1 Tax=Dryococelus australis TaxID=614101 RepID=A0ABQ9HII4_9NEOP|nr:hypothetical protein PR048_015891 [Dryococelus australis]